MPELKETDITQAVALYYDGDNAPGVMAKGDHLLAEQIVAIAQEHDIRLCDNRGLVNLLMELELDDESPIH